MTSYFSNFLTNRVLFSEQFSEAAKNIVGMAVILQSAVNLNTTCDFEDVYKQIGKKENIGKEITHKIYLCLNKIFFTPLSRPDIQSLASGLDDVADGIRETAGRIYLYHIDECSPAIRQIAALLLKACVGIENAISLLWSQQNREGVALSCFEVKSFEQQAARIYYQALAGLFSDEKNPVRLLKYREILLSLESTVNKCKSIADEINMVIING